MVYGGGGHYLNISKYYIYITLLIIINVICIAPTWNASQSALQQSDDKHQVLYIKNLKIYLKKSM